MKRPLTIIIPTWNNPEYFNPCFTSIAQTGVLNGLANMIVVNNGDQPISAWLKGYPQVKVLNPKENLGWEGGLKLALEHTDSEYVVFQNDDTFIPKSSSLFYQRLLTVFSDPSIGIVSPVTTVASGIQSIFHPKSPRVNMEASFLIFFCVMLRREAIDKAGGIDWSLPGGDDIDLSIRMRNAGYHLLINPDAFLIHHGFKTGTRIYGDGYAGVKEGWNSPAMIERTYHAIIRKHGFRKYVETMAGLEYDEIIQDHRDLEGDIVRQFTKGINILEMGCGGKKTIKNSIGVDRIKNGDAIPHVPGQKCVADIQADVQGDIPIKENSQDTIIARHILEHCLDPLKTLSKWNKLLKPGGRLILAVPDENITNGIPMNPEHAHAFNDKSLINYLRACGFREKEVKSAGNGVSIVGCFEKIEHMDGQYA